MNAAIQSIGWTLLHFIWQGAALAAVTAVALRFFRTGSAQARYALACAGLAMMIVAPLLTAGVLFAHTPDPADVQPRLVRIEVRRGVAALPGAGDFPIAPVPTTSNPDPVLLAAVVFWFSGVTILALRLGGGWWYVCRLHRRARRLAASQWTAVGQTIAARLGVTRLVQVVDSDLLDTPTVIGWISPVIVLPVAALANLSPAQVEGILAHELAHIRRHDYLANLLQTAAETLLFYHPAVWWLSARIRTEREHCCDDLAVAVAGDRVAYASALAELETFRATPTRFALAATGGSLLVRISRLLSPPADPVTRNSNKAGGALVLLMLVSLGATLPLLAATRGAVHVQARQNVTRVALRRDMPARAAGNGIVTRPDTLADVSFVVGPDRVTVTNSTLRDLVRFAYGVQPGQVQGGPEWLDSDRFNITAEGEQGPDPLATGSRALQTALAERFQLTLRHQSSAAPAYVLTTREDGPVGSRLRLSSSPCSPRHDVVSNPPDERSLAQLGLRPDGPPQACGLAWIGDRSVQGRGVQMDMVARALSQTRLLGREVIDRTGLDGTFDFDLDLTTEPTLAEALHAQLGLMLAEDTVPAHIVIVDRATRPERQ